MLKQTISKDREIEGLIKNTFVINKTTIKYNNINRYRHNIIVYLLCHRQSPFLLSAKLLCRVIV